MLDRRTFFKNTIVSASGLIVLPLLSFDVPHASEDTEEALEQGFVAPPASARPLAYWMWMNGHITKKGISRDLETMKKMGLSGAFIYNVSTGIPKGPISYGSAAWQDLVLHALQEARRLELEMYLHNAPGYSSTGASWVAPEMSMQQLVWTEASIRSKGSINVQLVQPYTKLDYYKDALVLAYPSLEGEQAGIKKKLTNLYVDDVLVDKTVLLDDNQETKIRLEPKGAAPAILLLEFAEAFEARAVSITRTPEPSNRLFDDEYDQPPSFLLESSDDNRTYHPVCTINMPLLRYIAAPGVQSFTSVKAKFFRLSVTKPTWLSGVMLYTAPRLAGWPSKANFADQELTPDQQLLAPECAIAPTTVIDVTDKMTGDGRLVWDAPAGDWTILRFGHTCTGTRNVFSPNIAVGLEIDKFSKEAVDDFFQKSIVHVATSFKTFIPDTFKGLSIDSYEIGKQNWTSQFPAAFRQLRAYDLTTWLPALTGRIVESVVSTEKFLWDIRRTHADLVAENYYGRFKQNCQRLGLQFLAQPYGDGVFDSLQESQYLDTALAEFWTRYVPGTIGLCDQTVSIAHGYGKKIIPAEAFTGMPLTSRWTEYPYALKAQGDHLFSRGINRFVFHVFVHQPYATGSPGMTMGPYGTHFDRNTTWINQAGPWIQYVTRAQYLLQQGIAVADVCYFKGEDPTSGIPDINHADLPVPRNIAGDVIGPDVLLKRLRIEKGRILLPDGMSYSVMILAPLKNISPEIVRKLQSLVADGMTLIVTSRPVDTPGLTAQSEAKITITKLVNELWGQLDGLKIKEQSFGKGKLFWNTPLQVILSQIHVKPDFEFTSKNRDAVIHYTHRRAGDADIYFISNHLRRRETIVCSFRIKNKTPELWNAETGAIEKAAVYESTEDRMHLPITFDPAGSVFVLFRKKETFEPFVSVTRNGASLLTTKPFAAVTKPFEKVADNFTIALWIKPDTYAYPGKGILIFPSEGEQEYGHGHACCGLAAGQNLVRVFERTEGPNRDAQQLIMRTTPLQGWTHLVLRYAHGKPSLFINGTLAGTHEGSGKIVHPGLQTPPTDELFSAIFEGNYTQPQLYTAALSDAVIAELFQKPMPPAILPATFSISYTQKGVLQATAWENGNYVLKGWHGNRALHIQECKTITIDAPWRLTFPQDSGAPQTVFLEKLASLHRHSNFDVRHFSGTVTYFNTFQLPEQERNPNRKVMLDLGRVEVLAEVYVNDVNLGILWKEPYSVDITKALVAGENKLEIRVTNLWPNRMICDAYLPEENAYDENGLITRFPDWYVNEQPKPGPRKTFSAWNTFKKTDPLLESGLLGPVRLHIGVEKLLA